MDENYIEMSPEEIAEYQTEYEAWLDQNPDYNLHLEQLFSEN